MMTKFRTANTDFYNGYFAARAVVDRAATHAAPKKPTARAPAPKPPQPQSKETNPAGAFVLRVLAKRLQWRL
jgi:hypothetical protein